MVSTPKKTKPKKTARRYRSVRVTEGDLLMVTWMDATATVGWEDHRQGSLKPAHCRSVGWLGKSTDDYLVLYADRAHEDTQDHDSNRRMAIPAGWITSIKKVRA
jgi:hypothetical protein